MLGQLWAQWTGHPKPDLPTTLRERLQAWEALPEPTQDSEYSQRRWVVVDVESSGLDVRNDSLIAIGAVAVRDGAIDHHDSFEAVLRQERISTSENILIHGIAASEQREGRDPATVLVEFLEFIGKDPLIAFHAFFDEAMIGRACNARLGLRFARPWLDLAHLAPALMARPDASRSLPEGLDAWLAEFNLSVSERHRAVADAHATAKLWLSLCPEIRRAGLEKSREVLKLARDVEWAQQRGLRS